MYSLPGTRRAYVQVQVTSDTLCTCGRTYQGAYTIHDQERWTGESREHKRAQGVKNAAETGGTGGWHTASLESMHTFRSVAVVVVGIGERNQVLPVLLGKYG